MIFRIKVLIFFWLQLTSCNDNLNNLEFASTENSPAPQIVSPSQQATPTLDPTFKPIPVPTPTNSNTNTVNVQQTPDSIDPQQTPESINPQQTPVSIFATKLESLSKDNPCNILEADFPGIVMMDISEQLPNTNRESITGLMIRGSRRDLNMTWSILQSDFPNLRFIQLSATGTNNKLRIETDLNSTGLIVITGTGHNNNFTLNSTFSTFFQLSGTGDTTFNINLGETVNSSIQPSAAVCSTGDSNSNIHIVSTIESNITITGNAKVELDTNGTIGRAGALGDSRLNIKVNHPDKCPLSKSQITCS